MNIVTLKMINKEIGQQKDVAMLVGWSFSWSCIYGHEANNFKVTLVIIEVIEVLFEVIQNSVFVNTFNFYIGFCDINSLTNSELTNCQLFQLSNSCNIQLM